jgi:hypothetical protein
MLVNLLISRAALEQHAQIALIFQPDNVSYRVYFFIKPQRHRDHRESRRMGDKKYSVYICALVFKKYPTYHPIPDL